MLERVLLTRGNRVDLFGSPFPRWLALIQIKVHRWGTSAPGQRLTSLAMIICLAMAGDSHSIMLRAAAGDGRIPRDYSNWMRALLAPFNSRLR